MTFNTTPIHDPGGKVRLRLPDGIRGEACFSPSQQHRYSLSRDWTPDGETARTVFFIGMNPSTADAFVSDPTVARETGFARAWGYTHYLKGNVLDWRATNPKDLPKDPDIACSEHNLAAIRDMADQAEEIILAYGRLHARYQAVTQSVIDICRSSGKPLLCFGKNADGSAKHPLYLAKTTPRIPF